MRIFALILTLFLSTQAWCNSHLPNHRHIEIRGKAQMLVKPDSATVYLAVESQDESSLRAKTEVDKRVNDFLSGLARFGIDEKNISASELTVDPRYSYPEDQDQVLIGHTAKRKLKVTLKDLSKLNELMDFALKVKINELRKIELTTSKLDSLNAQVMKLAVEDAKANAQALAEAFGTNLGNVYSINQNSNSRSYRYGSNDGIEVIEVSGVRSSDGIGRAPHEMGKYLQENIVISGFVNVVFDLETK